MNDSTRRQLLAATALGALPLPSTAQPLRLRYPGGRDANDLRYEALEGLLKLAFGAAGQRIELERVMGMSQRRAILEAHAGQLDVSLVPTSLNPPQGLQVLRVPVRRGLLGLRLLLAPEALLARLAAVQDLNGLHGLRMGYGADWDDLPTMRTLGFDVVTGDSYSGLFRMLAQGRFDWMHRGVNEIWAELDHPSLVPHGLAVVPKLALYYPLDDYFCVSPRRPDLFALLQRGMQRIRTDGRYARWFRDTYARALERAQMKQRHVLHLNGYGVPPETPLQAFDVVRLSPTQGELRLPD
jgi:ABC-type amino acid transport substrate-binding protein